MYLTLALHARSPGPKQAHQVYVTVSNVNFILLHCLIARRILLHQEFLHHPWPLHLPSHHHGPARPPTPPVPRLCPRPQNKACSIMITVLRGTKSGHQQNMQNYDFGLLTPPESLRFDVMAHIKHVVPLPLNKKRSGNAPHLPARIFIFYSLQTPLHCMHCMGTITSRAARGRRLLVSMGNSTISHSRR